MAATLSPLPGGGGIVVEVDPVAGPVLAAHAAATTGVHGAGVADVIVHSGNIGAFAPAPDLTTLVTLAPATSPRNTVQPGGATVVPLTLKGAAAQTAALLELRNSADSVRLSVDPSGNVSGLGTVSVSGSVTAGAGGVNVVIGARGPGGEAGLNLGSDVRAYRSSARTVVIDNGDGTTTGEVGVYVNTPVDAGGTSRAVWGIRHGGVERWRAWSRALNTTNVEWNFDRLSSGGAYQNTPLLLNQSGNVQTSSLTAIATSSSTIGVIAKGAASQTASVLEAQDSAATVLLSVSPAGDVQSLGKLHSQTFLQTNQGVVYFGSSSAYPTIKSNGTNTTLTAEGGVNQASTQFVVKMKAAQANADRAFAIQDSAGVVLMNYSHQFQGWALKDGGLVYSASGARVRIDNRLGVATDVTTTEGLRVSGVGTGDVIIAARGLASQTGDLFQAQNSAGTVVARVKADGTVQTDYVNVQQLSQPAGNIALNVFHGLGVIVNFGNVVLGEAGKGLRLKSPDGLTTKTLTIDNAGAPIWT